MTTKEMIAVMQAYEEGKKIQYRLRGDSASTWRNAVCPCWDWRTFDYRIKPEEEKPKRMTRRQLAEWCSMGKGLVSYCTVGVVSHYYWFYAHEIDEEVSDEIAIMPKGTNGWIEPTVDIYERDCKGN